MTITSICAALHRPKGISKISNSPKSVAIAVFGTSPESDDMQDKIDPTEKCCSHVVVVKS